MLSWLVLSHLPALDFIFSHSWDFLPSSLNSMHHYVSTLSVPAFFPASCLPLPFPEILSTEFVSDLPKDEQEVGKPRLKAVLGPVAQGVHRDCCASAQEPGR